MRSLSHTGGSSALLLVDLNKHLAENLLSIRGIRVPMGVLLTPAAREPPPDRRVGS